MDAATILPLSAAAVVVVLAAVTTLVVLADRGRVRRELAASRADVDALARRVEELARGASQPLAEVREFRITSMPDDDASQGRALAVPGEPMEHVSAGRFVSVAAGESAVRLVSLGYGVRRALSAESRHRIGHAVRQEMRRSRRQRRRDVKEAKRHLRAHPAPVLPESVREDVA